MSWVDIIISVIQYIESHIYDDITVKNIGREFGVSPMYLQKCFYLLTGYSLSEYIRNRKLTLAGSELISSNIKIIDLAFKYGYESTDSFTKAFTRFHGTTPSKVRKDNKVIRSFAPLKIEFIMKGGYLMDYKIEKKKSFKVIGTSKTFSYDAPFQEVPQFWNEHYMSGNNKYVKGIYGINNDKDMSGNEFEYIICDDYDLNKKLPEQFKVFEIPEHTWAIFPCVGAVADKLPEVNKKIFNEWLLNCKDYEIAEGYFIEKYSDPSNYENGISDKNYYCEAWIPIKRK